MSGSARAEARGGRSAARIVAWLPPLAWAAFAFWLGGRPGAVGPDVPGLDKVAHFVLYGVLGLLAGRAWRASGRVPRAAFVVILGCAVGAADELHQTRVPTRSADPLDFAADVAGVLLGFAAGRRRQDRGRDPVSE